MVSSIFYYIAPLLCYLSFFIKEFKRPLFRNILFIILALFICGGYMTGSDWRNYEPAFYDIQKGGVGNPYWAPGYIWLNKLFVFIGFDFWLFFVTLKIVLFFSIIYFFYYFSKFPLIALGLFISKNGYYLFVDNPMRNLIAIVLVGFSIISWVEHRQKLSIVLAVSSLFFHYASISYLVLLPIAYYLKDKSLKKVILIVTSFCLAASFHSVIIEIIIFIAQAMLGWIPSYFSIENSKSIPVTNSFIIILSRLLLIFPFLLLLKKKIKNYDNKTNFLFGLSCVYCVTFVVSRIVPILFRISMFFEIFTIIYLLECLQFIKKKNIIYAVFMLCFISSYFVYVATTHYCFFIPYSNVFYYKLIGEELSYTYRSEYNFKNSPYKGE